MKRIFALLLICLLLPLGGCAENTPENISVVATFYPVYVLAENVLNSVAGVTLTSMTPPATGCLHDYQLLTRDMRALSEAQMLLINGAGMESFLPSVVAINADLQIVDCSQGVELLPEEDHDEGGHHHEEHEHGEFNSHIWLDPQNAIQMTRNMAAALSGLLPNQADKIAANADAYIAELTALDDELRAAISLLPHKDIVTFHEAFPYFARAYDLNVVAVVTLEPDEAPSPRMLMDLIDRVRAAGNPPLFSEPQYESGLLLTVAQQTGAPVFELDPLVTGDAALTAYQDVMRKNLAVLQEALK